MKPESLAFLKEHANRVTESALAAVREGKMSETWLRENASNPAVREAAAIGMIRSREKPPHVRDACVSATEILGLNPSDFRTPAVQTAAKNELYKALTDCYFSSAVAINDLANLPPEYFSSAKTLACLETGVEQYQGTRGYSFQKTSFPSLLARLPIPLEFYQRPETVDAILNAEQQELYEGSPETLPLLRRLGLYERAVASPDCRRNAWRGMAASAVVGDDATARDYAKAFGFDLREMETKAVAVAYRQLIREGKLERAVTFARDCARLPEAQAQKKEVEDAAIIGAARQIEKEDLDGADELMDFVALPTEARQEAITKALFELLRKENAGATARVTERWNVPESVVRTQGSEVVRQRLAILRQNRPELAGNPSSHVKFSYFHDDQEVRDKATASLFANAWKFGERVRAIAGMSRDELEESACDGRQSDMGWAFGTEIRGWVPIHQEILAIRAIRRAEVGGSEFADRLVRRSVEALLEFLFEQESGDRSNEIKIVRREFGFVDNDMMHTAAVDACNSMPKRTHILNHWLIKNDCAPIAWEEVRDRARDYVVNGLLRLDTIVFQSLNRWLDIPREEQSAMIEETRDAVRHSVLHLDTDRFDQGRRKEIFDLYGFAWDDFEPRDIPFEFLVESKEPGFRERTSVDPWQASVDSLLKLQARSANEEHDPWTKEFFPLVERLIEDELLDRELAKDGALLVEYVRTFGMFDLPNVSRVYFRLKKGAFATLPDEDRQMILDLVGAKAARMGSENLINEMRKLRFEFQRDLLLDRVPRRIETALGSDIFLTIRGSTQWEDHDDDTESLMTAWRRTVAEAGEEIVRLEREAVRAIESRDEGEAGRLYAEADRNRERIAVAPGYEETTFAVSKTYRSKDGSSSGDEEAGLLLQPAHETGSPLCTALERMDLASATARVMKDGSYAPEDRRSIAARMEGIAAGGTGDWDLLLSLSANHVFLVAPEQWAEHLANDSFPTVEAELRNRSEFISQYLLEHYLNPAQVPDHTGHAPFSETLLRALAEAWDVGNDPSGSEIMKTVARIDAIRARQLRVSAETVDVTLVPAHGPLRIFAGDIGDACYTSQHHELASGGFPGVRAMIYVRNRGKSNERLAGSVLFVETRVAESNERVLVIRANNPRQNLVSQVDAASLVRQTVRAAVEIAKRRGIAHVAVVRDDASQASSNRGAVSEFYATEYADADRVALENEPGTNFNGYEIWNKDGEHPAAIVWTNEDTEAT